MGRNFRQALPTRAELAPYATRLHDKHGTEDVEEIVTHAHDALAVIRRLHDVEAPPMSLHHPDREPGRPPTAEEDPHHAIIRFCSVTGAAEGPLKGMRVGVKDNIAVAGVPMTEGRRALARVPIEDAVVIERLLDAGAVIAAKTNLTLSPGSEFGVVRNPLNPRFSPGASSSGSAAAVAGGLVDAALGTDEGGSIREPAAWCGLVGMKATHGLVPTYGKAYFDHTLDHIGPMTTTVADNAAILEVIAGSDWRDPQWGRTNPVARPYTNALRSGIRGLRLGVITNALDGCTAAALNAFDRACDMLLSLGSEIVPIDIPLWRSASVIWLTTFTCRLANMAWAAGQGYCHLGRIDTDRLTTTAAEYRGGTRQLPWLDRTIPVVAEYIRDNLGGEPFGRAQNLRLELRHQVNTCLNDVDLLISPTTRSGPHELNGDPARVEPLFSAMVTSLTGTVANLTGHPALTVPSGPGDHDLPSGLHFTGRHFDEYTIYRAASALEAVMPESRGKAASETKEQDEQSAARAFLAP